MPSIWIGGFLVIIHTADTADHNPPHVHVRLASRGGPEIRLCLTDVWLPGGEWDYHLGKMKANDIARALKTVRRSSQRTSRRMEAVPQMKDELNYYLRAKKATVFDKDGTLVLRLDLVGKIAVEFPLSHIGKFFTPARVRTLGDAVYDVKVIYGGSAIEWKAPIECSFSIAEMVPEYLGIVTAEQSARRAGSVSTPKKSAAARANGAKGGRPRKSAA